MRQYIDTLQDVQGNALVGATVLVNNYVGGAAASIFSDNGLTPILTSTVSTGADGQFSFFAADGDYTLVMSKNATVFKTQSPVSLFDGAAQLTFADVGAVNAYETVNSSLEKALRVGLRASFQAANTSTGASTFQYNGLAAKPLVLPATGALPAGLIIAAGVYTAEYDGTSWQLKNGGLNAGSIGGIIFPQTTLESNASVVPTNFNFPPGNVFRYGLKDDNSTDNAAKIPTIQTLGMAGLELIWPIQNTGIYLTSVPILFTSRAAMIGNPGARIKLISSAAAYVVKFDYSGSGASFNYGGLLQDLILDGGNLATDGLYLRNVINANFYRVRATNVTGYGLHCAWAQLCYFDTFECSGNIEPFSHVPTGGMLIDNANAGGASSANTFVNYTIEGLQTSAGAGIGINAKWAINSVWLNGTSEGNKIGFILGNATNGDNAAQGNKLIGGDVEANTTWDLQILGNNTFANDILGPSMTSASSVSITNAAAANRIIGGLVAGVTLDNTTQHNVIDSIMLFGNSAVISDSGVNNVIRNVWNVSSGASTSDQPARRRGNLVVSATAAVAIDCALVSLAAINYTAASASVLTISAPTNIRDAMDLEICLHVQGAGALTLAWNAIFKLPTAGVTVPAAGFNRTYRFRFDSNFGGWYLVSQTAADVAN